MDRNTIYTMLDKALWLRSPIGNLFYETGMTIMYRPGDVIGRTHHPEISNTLQELATQQQLLLGFKGHFQMVNWNTPYSEQVKRVMNERATDLLFFEGFAFDEETEGCCHLNPLRQLNIILSEPGSSNKWADKGYFRLKVSEKYGHKAIPLGKRWSKLDVKDIIRFMHEVFERGHEKVILKAPGAGGIGNTIVDRKSIKDSFWVDNLPVDQPIIAEAYVTWITSPCTSFFCWKGEVVFMEMCEQILKPKTAGFIGGKSFGFLSTADMIALSELQRPIAEEAHKEGINGFLGIDTILREPLEGDRLILPDSGLAVLFIEMNPRLNGHNQERCAVYRIAKRQGLDPNTVAHLRVGNKPMPDTTDASSARAKMKEFLSGIAKPLQVDDALKPGDVFFIPAENHGEKRPSALYDGIMFFGIDAERGILNAYKHLTKLKLIKR